MRVLYVNQTGHVSGAERSLLTLLDALGERVTPVAACPSGELAAALRAHGAPVHPIPATDASFRFHPIHTSRALAEMAAAAARVAVTARRSRAQLVHANTTRAGLIALLANRMGGPPVIVHVRDWVPPGRTSAAILGAVRRGAAAVIANSRWTADQLPSGRGAVHTLPNPIDLTIFDPDRHDRDAARAALGLNPEDEAIGVIGQLTPWKGQADAVAALAVLRRTRPRARLLVVGSAKFTAAATRYDNAGYARDLAALPARVGLAEAVDVLGERQDVPRVLGALDVLLVPSWREAFGRVAAEGLAMGVPVIATAVGGPAEIVRDGVDGRILQPRDPLAWASALDGLLADPALRRAMGRRGRERATKRFAPEAHADAVAALYAQILGSTRRAGWQRMRPRRSDGRGPETSIRPPVERDSTSDRNARLGSPASVSASEPR
jgi:glycosyltransferase involved in cell wall biosynthesis